MVHVSLVDYTFTLSTAHVPAWRWGVPIFVSHAHHEPTPIYDALVAELTPRHWHDFGTPRRTTGG